MVSFFVINKHTTRIALSPYPIKEDKPLNKITDNVYYTGVLNPNLRVFDVIMRTDYGTSYNSYLVMGSEKTALIEASHNAFWDYYRDNIKEVLGERKVDYLILNHTEPDHTGCINDILDIFPDIEIVVSPAAGIYIKNISGRANLNIRVVKDADSIDLGGKTLSFINAPFLHWPDSMFTWLPEDKILFSCDFLGCHFCEPQIYDTSIVYKEKYWDAFKYYYECIFGPFAGYVINGLDKIKDLPLEYICNSHGPILTKAGYLCEAMRLYREYAQPKKPSNKQVPIFYATAYGNTQKLAEAVAEGIKEIIPAADVNTYNVIEHPMEELASLLNESDAFLVGALTINREVVPPISVLLSHIEAVNIVKRPVAVFSSFGWSGEGIPHVEERLRSLKLNVFDKSFKVNFVPTPEELEKAREFGREFARTL